MELRWNEVGRFTWLVQTLLNVTKANVCASIVLARSSLARKNGKANTLSRTWGKKASDSILKEDWFP